MFGCHAMNNQVTAYCEALSHLLDEHKMLRTQMDELTVLAKRIISDPLQNSNDMSRVKAACDAFQHALNTHSAKEEAGLFTILGRYIGTEAGPIAVMEYEHEEAKKLLAMFNEMYSKLPAETSPYLTTELGRVVTAACQLLSDHFAKEENVLFPMAQNMLSDGDKESLLAFE